MQPEEVAYIVDDTNDLEVMKLAGITACPANAISFIKEVADIICEANGGQGCFRELAELIIASHQHKKSNNAPNQVVTLNTGNKIGPGEPCYIIAEIGINHNGSLEIAKQLIDEAVAAKATAVKFQKRNTRDLRT